MGGAELLWLVLLAVAFWLLLIRPQRKRQMEMLNTQRAVGVGDEVMTNAGFFGRVTAEVDDPAAGDCLMLELAPGTEVKVARGAVLKVVTAPIDSDPEVAHEVEPDPVPDPGTDTPDDPHRSN
ncbi:preprotein translocase subunit YajC [Nocardioides marmoribigeumensis]|uniref:Preprotein translocase subunit YajC n=1 Tax=Nocardioides marmoribigeumensis TaxID=433649 RepID=A0ABU2BQV7_9ACTN|nr:preprotein translocase subunit YajC [Nocardioides marmoribigeumensis]MDR7361030.1 preprotein translocase subunit YajC [Nocardioides marmoribigeumensis]